MCCLKELLKSNNFTALLQGGEINSLLGSQEDADTLINAYKQLLVEEYTPFLLYNLGICYNTFSNYGPDYKNCAIEYIVRAANFQNGDNNTDESILLAQFFLGDLIYNNAIAFLSDSKLKEEELSKAFTWFQKAAKLPAAQYCLGWCYYFGMGIDEDKEKGIALIRDSANSGDIHALNFLKWHKICL